MSKIDGKRFVIESCIAEKKVLQAQLSLAMDSISHDGTMGTVTETHFTNYLKKYLPARYSISSGIVIDSQGATSDQIDIVIFDSQYTPTIFDQENHRYIPAEAVYAVIEVKPTIDKAYMEYATNKAESVFKLIRTSCPITHAGGEHPPKPHFKILAGIVASRIEWVDGLDSTAFLDAYQKSGILNFGISMDFGAFDNFDGDLKISKSDSALLALIFRFLKKLQSMGTVPAIDWNEYSKIFQ